MSRLSPADRSWRGLDRAVEGSGAGLARLELLDAPDAWELAEAGSRRLDVRLSDSRLRATSRS